MNNITKVNHIGLRVSDFEASTLFYNKLGFEAITGPIGPEPVAILLHPSGINLNLILNSNQRGNSNVLMDIPTKHTGYTHVALETDNAESLIAALSELQINLSGELFEHPTGKSFFIRDPDNNVIEFIEYIGLEGLTE